MPTLAVNISLRRIKASETPFGGPVEPPAPTNIDGGLAASTYTEFVDGGTASTAYVEPNIDAGDATAVYA